MFVNSRSKYTKLQFSQLMRNASSPFHSLISSLCFFFFCLHISMWDRIVNDNDIYEKVIRILNHESPSTSTPRAIVLMFWINLIIYQYLKSLFFCYELTNNCKIYDVVGYQPYFTMPNFWRRHKNNTTAWLVIKIRQPQLFCIGFSAFSRCVVPIFYASVYASPHLQLWLAAKQPLIFYFTWYNIYVINLDASIHFLVKQ